MERIRNGEYIADKKLKVRLINGNVVVRYGNSYIPLAKYLRDLYSPFYHANNFTTGIGSGFTASGSRLGGHRMSASGLIESGLGGSGLSGHGSSGHGSSGYGSSGYGSSGHGSSGHGSSGSTSSRLGGSRLLGESSRMDRKRSTTPTRMNSYAQRFSTQLAKERRAVSAPTKKFFHRK